MFVPFRRPGLAVLLLAAGLAGCVTDRTGEPPARPVVAAPAAAPQVTAARVPETKPPVPDSASAPASAPAPLPLPPRPPQRPAFPRVEASVFDGLTAERALTLFGTPDRSLRSQGDVTGETIWVYRAAGCRLEIAFHFSIADNALIAHAHDLRTHDLRTGAPTAQVPDAICLHTLAGRTASPPAQG
jgi:hypothetical protein